MSIRHHAINSLHALLAVIIVSGLVTACGTASQPAPQSSSPSSGSKPAESTKPASSAPAAAKEPLKIGTILTTSGPIGNVGNTQVQGLEIALEEINAAGGIMGRKVELIMRDDGGDSTKALTAAQELVEKNGVTLILGTTLSSPALAVLPYLTEQKVVNLGSYTADAAVDAQKYPYGFTGAPVAKLQSAILVEYAVKVLKLTKVGILAESGAFGSSSIPALKAQLEQRGVQAVGTEQYPQGAQDMTTQLNNLKKAGAEVILSATLAADNVRILKSLQSMGWNVPYLGNSDLATGGVVEGAGRDAMKQVYAYAFERHAFSDKKAKSQKSQAFSDKLAKKLNQNPLKESLHQQALFYDLLHIAKQAIEKAQSAEGPKVAAALEQITGYDGPYATFTFTKTNHGGLELDDLVMVKADSLQGGFFQLAPGY